MCHLFLTSSRSWLHPTFPYHRVLFSLLPCLEHPLSPHFSPACTLHFISGLRYCCFCQFFPPPPPFQHLWLSPPQVTLTLWSQTFNCICQCLCLPWTVHHLETVIAAYLLLIAQIRPDTIYWWVAEYWGSSPDWSWEAKDQRFTTLGHDLWYDYQRDEMMFI